jgi:N-formylglutamate amidohydrolase
LTDESLELELNRLTDHYTDELFATTNAETSTLRFPISRFVVDPERFPGDASEPMAARGQGVIYTGTTDRQPLRRPPTPVERQRLLDQWYWPRFCQVKTGASI